MSRSQSLACGAIALLMALVLAFAVTGSLAPQTAAAAGASTPAAPDSPPLLATWPQQDFQYPYAVAVDSYGNVYVAETNNNRIRKFTPGGTLLATWGTLGSGDGQLFGPHGVAVDSQRQRLCRRYGQQPHPEVRSRRHIPHYVGLVRQRRRPVL